MDSEASSDVWELSKPPSNKSKLQELEPEEKEYSSVSVDSSMQTAYVLEERSNIY